MKPVDETGREIDAIFSVETREDGVFVILESRGGADDGPRQARNPEYSDGLELLLRRLGRERAELVDIEVFSRETQTLPVEQRRITAPGFPLPLNLATLADQRALRLQLGRASAALGRDPSKTSGGNPTKRLRLSVLWPNAAGRTAGELEDVLAGVSRSPTADGLTYDPLGAFLRQSGEAVVRRSLSEIAAIIGRPLPREAWTPQFWSNAAGHHQARRRQWLSNGYEANFEKRTETVAFTRRTPAFEPELPTDDPDELRSRAKAARTKMNRAAGDDPPPPPPGNSRVEKTTSTGTRYVRDPNVVAWVLNVAAGVCEVCDEPAPFEGADGEPFLEVHHVRPLAEGGPDKVDNAVAACPNCHRRLHLGKDRERLRAATIAKVPRLLDHPAKPTAGASPVSAVT